MDPAAVVVVGIGADGWDGLDAAQQGAVRDADVVVGGDRHLAMLPDSVRATRRPWPRPLREGLPGLLEEHAGQGLVALASGDPLVAGVATTLLDLLGPASVEVLPAVSSVALARARMRWPAESVEVLRDHRTLPRHLAPGRRLLVLSADDRTPGEVARSLVAQGFGPSRLTLLGDLGAPEEVRHGEVRADAWPPEWSAPALHVLAVECVPGAAARSFGLVPGLPDDAFEHDGQLTRRDVRASALARLAPAPGELLWDLGAGAGSVGIEWMRAHPGCRTIAVEADGDRAARVSRNARSLGVPDLRVVHGRAPEALVDLPRPDAIFVGGGASSAGLLERCLDALAPGGRLVVHGVTLETETTLARAFATHGGELTRLAVESAAPLGGMTGWTPARAVTQWSHRHGGGAPGRFA